MTKPRGPVLQTQAARTSKKTVLALAALLGLQVAAIASGPYDDGWKWNGDCWCSFSLNAPLMGQGVFNCMVAECQAHYSGHDEAACEAGGIDEAYQINQTLQQPSCMGRSL